MHTRHFCPAKSEAQFVRPTCNPSPECIDTTRHRLTICLRADLNPRPIPLTFQRPRHIQGWQLCYTAQTRRKNHLLCTLCAMCPFPWGRRWRRNCLTCNPSYHPSRNPHSSVQGWLQYQNRQVHSEFVLITAIEWERTPSSTPIAKSWC